MKLNFELKEPDAECGDKVKSDEAQLSPKIAISTETEVTPKEKDFLTNFADGQAQV